MFKHISIFAFSNAPSNGKTKEENIKMAEEYLATIPDKYPAVSSQQVFRSLAPAPHDMPDDAPVIIGDLVQIMSFETKEGLDGYAPSEAHRGLIELTDPVMKKVTAFDYED